MDYTVQRIETDAHTRPFTAGAQFSLSVGDFEGPGSSSTRPRPVVGPLGDAPNRTP